MRQMANWQMSRTQTKTDRISRRQSTTMALCRRQRHCKSRVHDSSSRVRLLRVQQSVHRQRKYMLNLDCKDRMLTEYTRCMVKNHVGRHVSTCGQEHPCCIQLDAQHAATSTIIHIPMMGTHPCQPHTQICSPSRFEVHVPCCIL